MDMKLFLATMMDELWTGGTKEEARGREKGILVWIEYKIMAQWSFHAHGACNKMIKLSSDKFSRTPLLDVSSSSHFDTRIPFQVPRTFLEFPSIAEINPCLTTQVHWNLQFIFVKIWTNPSQPHPWRTTKQSLYWWSWLTIPLNWASCAPPLFGRFSRK